MKLLQLTYIGWIIDLRGGVEWGVVIAATAHAVYCKGVSLLCLMLPIPSSLPSPLPPSLPSCDRFLRIQCLST